MRILWFTSTPSLAATKLNADTKMTGWVASLEKHLSEANDIDLGVAFPFGYKETNSFIINKTSYFTFPFHKEKGKVRGLWGRWTHKIDHENSLGYYLEVIEKFNPDLIHIFGSENSFGNIITHVNIPVVLQIQGNLSVCTLKYFSGISRCESIIYSNKKSFLLGYNTWHQFYTFRKRALREQTFLRHFKYFIGRTDWDKYVSGIMSPGRIYFHCDEILRNQFYANRWSEHQNTKVILFSTLSGSTYKGFETVLLTAHFLKNANNFDFEWQIAGIEVSHEIIKITERAYKLKFSANNIVFKGLKDEDELVSGLLASDIFVHPSHIENSSNSVCEAMLLGVPVIATYAGGTPSIIQNGFNGLLVQDGDPYVLAGAIKELAGSVEKRKLFSDNGRETAVMRHDPLAIVRSVADIYKSVLNS